MKGNSNELTGGDESHSFKRHYRNWFDGTSPSSRRVLGN